MRTLRPVLAWAAGLSGAGLAMLALWAWPTAAPAQPAFQGKVRDFMFPDYYSATATNQTNQVLKSVVSGAEAKQVPGGWLITDGRIKTYRLDGQQELEVQTTECFYSLARHEASGPGHLIATNSIALSSVQGEGFFWRQSDGFLIISNHVLAVLQRGLLTAATLGGAGLTNAPTVAAPPTTGQVVRISSDRCVVLSASNRIEQTGHVLAEDAQMDLACQSLTAQFNAARRLQELVADRDVRMLNKTDESRVTAGRAEYRLGPEREIILLTEQPRWQDQKGGQWAKATRFSYDLRAHSLLGEGGASLQLPRSSFVQPGAGLIAGPPATNAPAAGADTNHVQVSAETMTLLLASTNRPHRRATAERGVVVTSPTDDLRATGDRLVWQEETGLAELTGHAAWTGQGQSVQAETLVVDRTNRVFRGASNVFFRLPLKALGPAGLVHAGTNHVTVSNLFLEVLADDFVYRTNALECRGAPVRSRLLEGQRLQGLLTCGVLTVRVSNRLDRLLAEKHVVAEHYPPPGTNRLVVTNLLACEVLAVRFSESGEVVATVASEHVQAAQIQTRAAGKPLVSELTCGLLTAVLLPKAGLLDKLQAEDHVAMSQADKRARAEMALFTDRDNQVSLTGHPVVEFAGGRVTDADALVWDRASGAFWGRGKYRIEWTVPALPTNLPGFLFLKK